jgi:ABC-type dipeptide/oligopeptide/nickel transport system ATPase subunit
MRLTQQITRSVAITPSPRLTQVLGMFDVEQPTVSTQAWDVDLQLPDDWNIGVIVGPSGSGKSTIARELFGQYFTDDFNWPVSRSILDAFPASLSIKQITGLLSSVGFSSPPAWVRPFNCLSNGQQFRVNLARILADGLVDRQIKIVDEYSSVVDRTVAQIGSAAVARTVRRNKLQFIAVTCHYDVLDWLEPDWVYDVAANAMHSEDRESKIEDSNGHSSAILNPPSSILASPPSNREGLRRYKRPAIELEIIRTDRSAWPRFKPHHYLTGSLNPSAACYVAMVNDQPAAFTAVLPFPHPSHPGYREHRTVCLPDFQGVGIGNAMSEFIAGIYRGTGKPYYSTTSHPAMIHHRAKSPLWRMTRKPGLTGGGSKRFSMMRKTAAIDRLTAGFEFVGPPRFSEARQFNLIPQESRAVPGPDDFQGTP